MVEGFKNTDFGVIPNEWEVKSIQELLDDNSLIGHLDGNHGELYPKYHEFVNFGIPYIAANDFASGHLFLANCKFLTTERASLFKKGIAKDGDILFAHNATVGPVALLNTNLKYVILSTTATYYRCNPAKISNIFLLYVLQSSFFVRQYRAVMMQSTRAQVPITAQRRFSIFLPNKTEQNAIGTVLNDTDQLINQLQKLIAKKKDIKQGAMQELLKPKAGWVVKTIKEIAKIYTGSKNTQDRIETGAYPFFVRSNTIEKINTFCYDGEAILTAGDGVGVGKVIHYINGKYDCHQRVYQIRDFDKSIFPYYLYLFFKNNFYDRIMQMTAKSSVDSVRMEMIAGMKIPFSTSINEQKRIANIISEMEEEIQELEKQLEKQKMLKQGMMQSLLSGKIRLINKKKSNTNGETNRS